MSKVPKFDFEDRPPAKPAEVANPFPNEALTLASLATLARGKNEKQPFHSRDEVPLTSPPVLEKCHCGSPAWDTDAEGKQKCWSCLAIRGLFGTH